MKPNLFYNTINLTSKDIERAEADCRSQEELILSIFEADPSKGYTPYEIWLRTDQRYPATSIRRAMTNLSGSKHGYKLEMTNEMRKGQYGKPNHVWTIRKGQLRIKL